jgi:hypothetical protein
MGYTNPLFDLPAAKELLALDEADRKRFARLFQDLRHQANQEAELCWKRRKAPMAAYWRAVATYARHVLHTLHPFR